MDLGLFVFLGFFAYSSLIIKARSNSIFVVLPILALGVVACAILGTYTVYNEGIVLATTQTSAINATNYNYYPNGTMISYMQSNSTGIDTNPVLTITEEWGVVFFTMFHFLLAFINVVQALYFISDKIEARNQFKN